VRVETLVPQANRVLLETLEKEDQGAQQGNLAAQVHRGCQEWREDQAQWVLLDHLVHLVIPYLLLQQQCQVVKPYQEYLDLKVPWVLLDHLVKEVRVVQEVQKVVEELLDLLVHLEAQEDKVSQEDQVTQGNLESLADRAEHIQKMTCVKSVHLYLEIVYLSLLPA